jgi:hypothetical protein
MFSPAGEAAGGKKKVERECLGIRSGANPVVGSSWSEASSSTAHRMHTGRTLVVLHVAPSLVCGFLLCCPFIV